MPKLKVALCISRCRYTDINNKTEIIATYEMTYNNHLRLMTKILKLFHRISVTC